jgi:hypothetical protein
MQPRSPSPLPLRGLAPLAALCLSACAWKGPMPAVAMGEAELSHQVIVLDEECWRSVGLQGLRVKQSPEGILLVRVEVGNRTDGDHNVELRVLFGDERGRLVGEDPPWENLVVPREAYTIFQAHSQGPAEQYRIELRSP